MTGLLLLPSTRGLVVLIDQRLHRVLLFGSSRQVTYHLYNITFSTTSLDIAPLLLLSQLASCPIISMDLLLLMIFELCAIMVWKSPFTTFFPCPLSLLILAPYPPQNPCCATMTSRIMVRAPSGVFAIVTNYTSSIALSGNHLRLYQSNCCLNLSSISN